MPGVTDEQIAAARSVDLLSYLQAYEPGSIRKSGPDEYRMVEHNSLKISNGKWYRHSRSYGSNNALDFLMWVRGMKFADAVSVLADGRATPGQYNQPQSSPSEKQRKLFALPIPNRNNHRAIAYLMGRGISRDVIGHCIRAGSLYESVRHHNCVFVGKDTGGKPRFACQRSTAGDFKRDVTGSDKRYSFAIPARDSPDLYVFEAPVDLLSLATIRQRDSPESWTDAHYLSLGGTSMRALDQYLKDHPDVRSVALCLDNDQAGRDVAAKIRSMLEPQGYKVSDMLPLTGKDWNQHLQNTIRQEKSINQSRSYEAAISI